MFATDPTLYGATFPQREIPFMNPFFAQQFPWQDYRRFIPPVYQEFPEQRFVPPVLREQYMLPWMQQFYGHKFLDKQLPYTPFMQHGLYNLPQYNLPQYSVPQYNKWQFPYIY
jgi:hypothetical protein